MVSMQDLRLVWLGAENVSSNASSVYRSLFDAEPDTSSSQKTPSPQRPFLSEAGGMAGEYRVEVTQQYGRLDAIIRPPTADGAAPVPEVINSSNALDFVANRLDCCQNLPPANRLSVISRLLQVYKTTDDAKSGFHKFIGHDFDVRDAMDLQFHLNRRKTIEGFDCNRLAILSVTEFHTVAIELTGTPVARGPITTTPVLSLVLDFNLVPVGGNIPPENQKAIFGGLISEVRAATEEFNISYFRK